MRHSWAKPFLACLISVGLLVAPAAEATPLVDPDPLLVPPGLSEASVAKAIRLGSARRGWLVTRDEPGLIEATLKVRTHMVRVAIQYDRERVGFRYLASENMEYSERGGRRHIHGNYNKWTRNLAADVSVELAQLPPDAP